MAVGTCCKYLMFFFNLLVFIKCFLVLGTIVLWYTGCRALSQANAKSEVGGAVLLSLGIWVAIEAESFRQVATDNSIVFNSVYIILGVGALLLIVGFLGCCGAVQENKCMLGTFFILILILFFFEIAGAVLAFVYYPQARDVALQSMEYYGQTSPKGKTITAGWDSLQSTLKCCGFNGMPDWTARGKTFPQSCELYSRGCESALQRYFWVLGGVACGVLVIELLAMIFACCIYQNI